MSKKIAKVLIGLGALIIVLGIILRVTNIVVSFAFWLFLILGIGLIIIGVNFGNDESGD